MRVGLLSNVNLELVGKALRVPTQVWSPPGYGEWVVHTYDQGAAGLRELGPDQVLLLLDGTALLDGVDDGAVEQELDAQLVNVRRLAATFSGSRVVVSTLDFSGRSIRPATAGRPEEHWALLWRTGVEKLARQATNVHVFDLARLACDVGRRSFYSPKMWYLGGQPFAMSATKILAAAIDETLRQPTRSRKKVMVVDLDNTLWGGVVGEDGPSGLAIGPSGPGAAYRDVQRRLKELSMTGVLLAAVSKNEPADVQAAFEQNRQMVLQPEDFVAVAASWDPKPQVIESLAHQLNLGLASFVFLDDNPVEREAVRQQLPEVTVLDFPRDVAALPQVVVDAAAEHFWTDRLTDEDKSKTDHYRQDAARAEARAGSADIDDYLRGLQVRITVGEMGEAELVRTAQLTQKTNQFNVLTRRWTSEELSRLQELTGERVYTAQVSDRFGDAGQVVVVMVHVDGDEARIDNLLMSCRVMGRAIEDGVLSAIENRLASEGIRWIHAAYERTERNTPVQDLFDRMGFDRVEESADRTAYRRALDAAPPGRRALHTVVWEDR